MNFNLTFDPWIPVRWLADGRVTSVGLDELFARASEIADLSAPPHERISILRLLVCITQASLGAPATSHHWTGWGSDFESAVPAYLAKCREHFNLFGDGARFLQSPIKDNEVDEKPTGQMVFHLATGNSVTLFDHAGDDKNPRSFDSAEIARAILVYQNHFDCDLMGQSPAFKGVPVAGTAIHGLHTFLIGGSVRETILLNCVDLESLKPTEFGKPSWEGGDSSSYLHRLVPIPCKIWLSECGKRTRIKKGVSYLKYTESGIRECSTSSLLTKRNGVDTEVLLKARIDAGIWRDLHCIFVLKNNEKRCPVTFQSHLADLGEEIRFWSGELVKTKGKILDAVESFFTVPYQLFSSAGQLRYESGVGFANLVESTLCSGKKNAVKTCFATLKQNAPPTDAAKRHFWNTLDQQSSILLRLLENLGTPDDPMGTADFGKGKDPWSRAVRAAAEAAYDHVCPRQSPRQKQAYAAGLKILRSSPAKPVTKRSPEKSLP